MSTIPPTNPSAAAGSSNPLSSGYYGSYYSMTFEVKFKRKVNNK